MSMVSPSPSPEHLTSIMFDLSGNTYPESFPQSIPLNEFDPLTAISFKDSYEASQAAGLPYYSVAVVESGKTGEKFYQVYDTSFFATHIFNKGPKCKDPITNRPIQKVHYFAAKCFKFDKDKICSPIDISAEAVSLSPFKVDNDLNPIQTMLLDSINNNIMADGTKQAKSDVRRMQYIIASLVQKGQFFSTLNAPERRMEAIRWLWSSAQGSYIGLGLLAKECLDTPYFSKDSVLNLLSKSLSLRPKKEELSLRESKAFVEALDLLRQLKTKLDEESNVSESPSPIKELKRSGGKSLFSIHNSFH